MRTSNLKSELVKLDILAKQLDVLCKELKYVDQDAVNDINYRIASAADQMRQTADKLFEKATSNYLSAFERSGEV